MIGLLLGMVKRIETKRKDGATRVYAIRQLPHDKQLRPGMKLFGETILTVSEQTSQKEN